jgi:hypothetical protein
VRVGCKGYDSRFIPKCDLRDASDRTRTCASNGCAAIRDQFRPPCRVATSHTVVRSYGRNHGQSSPSLACLKFCRAARSVRYQSSVAPTEPRNARDLRRIAKASSAPQSTQRESDVFLDSATVDAGQSCPSCDDHGCLVDGHVHWRCGTVGFQRRPHPKCWIPGNGASPELT